MAVAPPKTITDVLIQFFGSAPTLEEIIAFELPPEIQARALELLQLNRGNLLTVETRAEIEEFDRVRHIINMIVLQARLRLAGKVV